MISRTGKNHQRYVYTVAALTEHDIRMLSVFSIVLLVNTIVNTILARFFFARLLWESREGPSRTYGWVALCTASIVAEIPGALACGVLYFAIWYWLSGLPAGEAAGHVFLSLLTFELFEVDPVYVFFSA